MSSKLKSQVLARAKEYLSSKEEEQSGTKRSTDTEPLAKAKPVRKKKRSLDDEMDSFFGGPPLEDFVLAAEVEKQKQHLEEIVTAHSGLPQAASAQQLFAQKVNVDRGRQTPNITRCFPPVVNSGGDWGNANWQ